MKVVINTAVGWFQLSEKATLMLGCEENSLAYETDHSLRVDPKLVRVVEKLGTRDASGMVSNIVVVEVPDGTDWAIFSDDSGREFVYDKKRVWGMKKG